MGSARFITNKPRWCLWLVGISSSELRKMPLVMERVERCCENRINAPNIVGRKLDGTLTRFHVENMPQGNYLIIPHHSPKRRRYISLGYMQHGSLCGEANFIMTFATFFHFGILISNMHMAWMQAVCGCIKNDYRYSKDVIYNNFPWPTPMDKQKPGSSRPLKSSSTSAPCTRTAVSPASTTRRPCPGASQGPPAERQGRHAGVWVRYQAYHRNKLRGGVDEDVPEADKGA